MQRNKAAKRPKLDPDAKVLAKSTDQQKLKPIHIGIDHGTTYTRVRVYSPNWSKEMRADIVKESHMHTAELDATHGVESHYDTFPDFPAFICPERDPPLSGFAAERKPDRIPLKTAALLLDQSKDVDTNKPRQSLLKKIPCGRHLLKHKHEEKFHRLIERLWKEHFLNIRKRIDVYCDFKYSPVSLTLSMPNWMNDERVDKIYESIIADVFSDIIPASGIEFIGEAQGMVRCIHKEFIEEKSRLSVEIGNRHHILVIDIGGSAMNGALCQIARDDSNADAITHCVEVDSFGCPGGSELWHMQIGDVIASKEGYNVASEDLQKLMQRFRQLQGSYEDPSKAILVDVNDRNYHLSNTQAKESWRKSFKDPIEMIERKVDEAVERVGDADLMVIFSGGSLKLAYLQNLIRGYMKNNHPNVPLNFIQTRDDVTIADNTGLIARGCAYARTFKRPVLEVLDRMALGVQDGSPIKHGSNEWHWLGDVKVLHHKATAGVTGSCTLNRRTAIKKIGLRIIADPQFQSLRAGDEVLNFQNCYDLYSVPASDLETPGEYTFQVSRIAPLLIDERHKLKLDLECVYLDKGQGIAMRKTRSYMLPLYFHIGTCCVLPKEDEVEISDWVYALAQPQPIKVFDENLIFIDQGEI
ncbi:hypothetical protein PpBr36_04167 [Pyricularia pennisetigena]|uniref:hypothetical protein n=1 Tax=Pyricularia pennisetigena TaxID=1578925 RepID=UPI001154E3ED|nr:hypothetical protein PpBr36_04167 [Pyricularia pennisetigena]TLS27589.1 hypothetical protein PpBr36_04167 [Pyricularia pennisetigena]